MTMKGVEPLVMASPLQTSVRISGGGGNAQWINDVIARNRAEISGFCNQQAQNYALSGVPQMRRWMGNAEVTVVHEVQFGMATVTITVVPPPLIDPRKPKPPNPLPFLHVFIRAEYYQSGPWFSHEDMTSKTKLVSPMAGYVTGRTDEFGVGGGDRVPRAYVSQRNMTLVDHAFGDFVDNRGETGAYVDLRYARDLMVPDVSGEVYELNFSTYWRNAQYDFAPGEVYARKFTLTGEYGASYNDWVVYSINIGPPPFEIDTATFSDPHTPSANDNVPYIGYNWWLANATASTYLTYDFENVALSGPFTLVVDVFNGVGPKITDTMLAENPFVPSETSALGYLISDKALTQPKMYSYRKPLWLDPKNEFTDYTQNIYGARVTIDARTGFVTVLDETITQSKIVDAWTEPEPEV
jgi:hypothetical protein